LGSIPGIPTTAVPDLQFTPQGVIIPPDVDILAGAQTDINFAFGGGVNPALTTPQGQFASSMTAIISDKDAAIALITNQIDPQFATGRFQDAIGRFYFMTRFPATATAVSCLLIGLPNTPIPAGTLAGDTAGNKYALTAAVTIGAGSSVMGQFQNIVFGPIPCPVGTLTKVIQAIPGWDTISNPTQGVLGSNVETPQEFELRRQNSVAANARGSTQSILGNIFETVPNILDCLVLDNPQGVTVLTGSSNFPLQPHSLYVGVVGGQAAAIAMAIWLKKDTGCNYNGNTTQTVLDTSPQYSPPFPSYQVTFNIPTNTPVLFAVQISNSTSLPSNVVALIQAAIIAQFNGQTNGQTPARMGAAITGSSYYGAIIGVAAAGVITVLSVLVGITAPTLNQVIMGIDQEPVISAANISVSLI
jgi:uncharacterized phage protein gp47/JayE